MNQRNVAITLIAFTSLIVGTTQVASAVPIFLKTWSEDVYPNSNSDDIGCQLCHQNSTGGNGWNAYGTDIWIYYNEQERDIVSAFRYAESLNSDGDNNNLTNLEEIKKSMFPGWVNSNSNNIFYKDYSFLQNQAPPFEEMEPNKNDNDLFCFNVISKNKNTALICL